MKLKIKLSKVFIILVSLFILWIFFFGIKSFLRLDISLNYLKVQGVSNIVFERNWKHQCYKRCFWGLKKIQRPQAAEEDILCESDDSLYELLDSIDTENEIRQSVYSPDKKYILYCEKEYNYTKSDMTMTDDEYCYYRVYVIDTKEIITIYQGYREWYDLLWLE